MITIKTKFDLTNLDTDDYVYIKTIKKIFRRVDGEWIEKKYYTVDECCAILGRGKTFINRHAEELHIKKYRRYNNKINLTQLLALKAINESQQANRKDKELAGV